MSWVIWKFDHNDALVDELADRVLSGLREGIDAKGRASIAVSGGSTPKSLFARLARSELDWKKVTITLVDERWVDENHEDANAKLVKDWLLQDKAAAATFIPMKTDDPDPFAAEQNVETRLRDVPMPFDVVILGMGGDGHTASFFPGASSLEKALRPDREQRCAAVRPPNAPHERMTLTLPVLLGAKHLILHVVGREKWQVLQRALQPGKKSELPVRAVLHQSKVLLDIYYAAE